MNTTINIIGDAGKALESFGRINVQAYRRAMRHVAYNTRLLLQAQMRNGTNGVYRLVPITDLQRTRFLDKFKGKKTRGGYPRAWRQKFGFGKERGRWRMFGKLIQTVKYKANVKAKDFVAQIGWLDKSSARLAAFFQKGQYLRVTPKMLRLFKAAGLSLNKRVIQIPKRQLITPFFVKYRRWMLNEFISRYKILLENPFSSANARRRTA